METAPALFPRAAIRASAAGGGRMATQAAPPPRWEVALLGTFREPASSGFHAAQKLDFILLQKLLQDLLLFLFIQRKNFKNVTKVTDSLETEQLQSHKKKTLTVWPFPKKSNTELPCDPVIPLLGIYPKEVTAGT